MRFCHSRPHFHEGKLQRESIGNFNNKKIIEFEGRDKILQYKYKKKLYKILFIVILLSFIVSLVGCNWFSLGLLNIFDPQAQIRVDYKLDGVTTEGTANISFDIFSLNEAEFIGTGFLFEYYNEGIKIPELSRMVGATFYVPPYPLSSFEKPVTIEFPLYFQDVLDYMTLHPLITEITSTITVMGTDGAGHDISKTITFDLPTILPGIDFEPPNAVINVTPGTTGNAPFSIVLDASSSTDNRGIASYSWDFGDNTSATGVLATKTYSNAGTFIVTLTVTDFFGNEGFATEIINIGETGGPIADIQVTPGTTGTAPFIVAFDASGSTVNPESGCGCSITSYSWDFGDGNTGTGIATTHTYSNADTYVVILTVTDSNAKVGCATVVITVTTEGEPTIKSITVIANPESNVPGGTSTISALVINTDDDVVPDGTTVYFYTNSGTLSADSADTTNGIATVTLTLAANMQDGEKAKVTAFIGAVSNYVEVTCIKEVINKIIVSANPESNVPGGTSTISAKVENEEGDVVADGTTVYFYTNSGALSANSAVTVNGIATVDLTLDDNMLGGEIATVTAFIGSVEGTVDVTCISPIVTIYADDYSIPEGGISNITAVVTKTDGTPVEDVIVIFFTNKGDLVPVYCPTNASGIAQTTLTLNTSGVATVTAKCGSRLSNKIYITCE
jgi:PKD repeat protein